MAPGMCTSPQRGVYLHENASWAHESRCAQRRHGYSKVTTHPSYPGWGSIFAYPLLVRLQSPQRWKPRAVTYSQDSALVTCSRFFEAQNELWCQGEGLGMVRSVHSITLDFPQGLTSQLSTVQDSWPLLWASVSSSGKWDNSPILMGLQLRLKVFVARE